MRKILFLDNDDPHLNLAHEEFLFSQLEKGQELIVLYQNRPSLVIGTFQNPWIECDTDWIRENDIPLVRRISGGGTVWHDRGNLNISFMSDRNGFQQSKNLASLCSILQEFGIPAEQNDRGDILVSNQKISGNALCFRAHKVMHHATLLVNADLSLLRRALTVKLHGCRILSSIGVRSKSAPVSRIVDILTETTDGQFLDGFFVAIESFFDAKITQTKTPEPILSSLMEKYQSWEWTWGRTPDFQVQSPLGSVYLVHQGMHEVLESETGFGSSVPFTGFASLSRGGVF